MSKFIKFQDTNDNHCCVAEAYIISVTQSPDYPAHYFVTMTNGDRHKIDESPAKKIIARLTGGMSQ